MQSHSFDHIPIIDLANLRSTGPRDDLVQQVKEACMKVGFLYVKNHGIPEDAISDVLSAAKSFFSLPSETKMEIHNKKSSSYMGYSPLLSGNNNPLNMGDLQEGFELGWEEEEVASSSSKNAWPSESELPQFRSSVLRYYHAVVSLGKLLFPLFALALDLPANFFDDKTRNSAALMKLLHYPPQLGPTDEKVQGIGAHTDWECFTILWQQPDIQALQVLNADKQWIDAPPIPGTLVINLGDQFARWTNDVFKSTIHRAINQSPTTSIPTTDRYSIPLFFGTDYDVKLEPIPGCITPENPRKYEVVTAGEYVKMKLEETYAHAHGE